MEDKLQIDEQLTEDIVKTGYSRDRDTRKD